MKGNPVYSISKKIVDKYNLVYVRKAYDWKQEQALGDGVKRVYESEKLNLKRLRPSGQTSNE